MFNLAALGAITSFYTGQRQTDVWIPLVLCRGKCLFSLVVCKRAQRDAWTRLGPSCALLANTFLCFLDDQLLLHVLKKQQHKTNSKTVT